jgi:bacteriocin biosynthesis cyclodehydratase domain-containing protein
MTSTYDDVANAKIRIKQDVLYSQVPNGVLFHNAENGFLVSSKSAYKLASMLVPYLDGRYTVAQLCQGLDSGQQVMVGELVSAILDRGFARDTTLDSAPDAILSPEVAQRFAAQINYVDHYAGDAASRFARLRASRIAVLGDDLVARWCVLSLVRNGASMIGVLPSIDSVGNRFAEVTREVAALKRQGCPVELAHLAADSQPEWASLSGFDTVVISVSDMGTRAITELLAEGIPDGVVLLTATTVQDKVLVGPLMTTGRAGCWVCATLRFGANGDTATAADLWSELVVPTAESGSGPSRQVSAMLGNLLAYEVFKVATGALPGETDRQVIIQQLDSLDAHTERLLPHPRCPHCVENAAPERLLSVEPSLPLLTSVENADDASQFLERLEDLAQQLVHPTVGVFTAFDDDQLTQLPLKVGRVRVGLGHQQRRIITGFDVHHVVGARLTALRRAAEVYVESAGPVLASVRSQGEINAIRPASLGISSGIDVHPSEVERWVRVNSLLTDESFLVPAAAVRSFGVDNRDGLCVATSAGTGAGHTAAEALGAGLSSALAYQALTSAIRGTDVIRVDLESLATDAELHFLTRSAGNLGIELELLQLTAERTPGVHVLLARTLDGETKAPIWTVGADLSWRRAAVRATCDLVGKVQVGRELGAESVDTGDSILRAFEPYTLTIRSVMSAPDLATEERWSNIFDQVRRDGGDILAVNTSPGDLRAAGVSAVRVLLVEGR